MITLRLERTARQTAAAAALSAAILLPLASCCSGCLSEATRSTESSAAVAVPQTVERIPAFSVKASNGQEMSPATLKGKLTILDFWATWCPPCRKEIPHFNQLFAEHRNKGLMIVGLALDENAADVAKFMRQVPIEYPVALAPKEVQQQFGGIEVYPTAFLVNREGKVVKKYLGFTYPDEFERDISTLINNDEPQ